MKLRLWAGICCALMLPALSWADTILISPAASTVTVSQTFSVNVTATNMADLYAFQFDLGFDPSILSALDVTEGPLLSTGGTTFFIGGSIDNVGGAISATAGTLETAISGVTGSGVIASIQFQAIRSGSTNITPFNVILLDSTLHQFTTPISSGTVTVNAASVPEPSSLVLLASGFIGFGFVAFKTW